MLAAAGARVVSFDLAEEQLANKDRMVAEREGLTLETRRGDMADLSGFADGRFDLVFHPVANVFVPDLAPVWRECHRVLRPGGVLLAGFMNPLFFLFDHEEAEGTGILRVRYPEPFTAPTSLDADSYRAVPDRGEALEFGHSLEAQIGGQLAAGFVLIGLYEDTWTDAAMPLNAFSPTSIATRTDKPERSTAAG